jgi:hypothetical protein
VLLKRIMFALPSTPNVTVCRVDEAAVVGEPPVELEVGYGLAEQSRSSVVYPGSPVFLISITPRAALPETDQGSLLGLRKGGYRRSRRPYREHGRRLSGF